MNAKSFFCAVVILLIASSSFACINKSGTKYGGGSGSYFGWRGLQNAIKKSLLEDGVEMERELRGATNFNDRSDYAVALMFLGRSAEAVELLNKLEQEQPGQFFVAANLGSVPVGVPPGGGADRAVGADRPGERRQPTAQRFR